MPVEGGKEVAIPQLSSILPGHWGVGNRGIYFVDFAVRQPGESVPVRLFDFQAQQLSKVGAIERIRVTINGAFTVSPDQKLRLGASMSSTVGELNARKSAALMPLGR